MPERDVKNIRKILLFRFSALGDIVMATPMIRCVRKAFPHAQIDMVCRKDFADLLEDNPHLDRKIGLDKHLGVSGLWKLYQELKKERYDLIYDAHQSLRTRFLMPFLPATHKRYYEKHYFKRALALTFKLPILRNERMLNRYIEPLEEFGVKWDGLGPEMYASKKARSRIEHLTLPKDPLIGFIPSAQWPGKRWPESHFREVLKEIVEHTDLNVVVFGGKNDHFCTTIAEGFPEQRVCNLQGKLSIAECTALLEHCQFTIANDTGLMHLADALNIPTVLMLGPTSREMGCLPFHPQSRVVEKDLWCRPCSKNGQAPCIRKKRWCLELISPREVFEQSVNLYKALGAH